MTSRKYHRLMVAPVLAVAIAGCSGTDGGSTVGGSTATAPEYFADYERATYYHSIAELTADSDLVVRVQGTGRADAAAIDGIPVVNTHVEVVEVIRGTAPKEIAVSQGGYPGMEGILDKERSYLLFLTRSTEAPDRYGVVGVEAGIYLEDSGSVTLMDPESPDLPKQMTTEVLKEEVLRTPGAAEVPGPAQVPATPGVG